MLLNNIFREVVLVKRFFLLEPWQNGWGFAPFFWVVRCGWAAALRMRCPFGGSALQISSSCFSSKEEVKSSASSGLWRQNTQRGSGGLLILKSIHKIVWGLKSFDLPEDGRRLPSPSQCASCFGMAARIRDTNLCTSTSLWKKTKKMDEQKRGRGRQNRDANDQIMAKKGWKLGREPRDSCTCYHSLQANLTHLGIWTEQEISASNSIH